MGVVDPLAFFYRVPRRPARPRAVPGPMAGPQSHYCTCGTGCTGRLASCLGAAKSPGPSLVASLALAVVGAVGLVLVLACGACGFILGMGAGSSFWRAAWRACCWKSAPST